jgi:hypothetical protein
MRLFGGRAKDSTLHSALDACMAIASDRQNVCHPSDTGCRSQALFVISSADNFEVDGHDFDYFAAWSEELFFSLLFVDVRLTPLFTRPVVLAPGAQAGRRPVCGSNDQGRGGPP